MMNSQSTKKAARRRNVTPALSSTPRQIDEAVAGIGPPPTTGAQPSRATDGEKSGGREPAPQAPTTTVELPAPGAQARARVCTLKPYAIAHFHPDAVRPVSGP